MVKKKGKIIIIMLLKQAMNMEKIFDKDSRVVKPLDKFSGWDDYGSIGIYKGSQVCRRN